MSISNGVLPLGGLKQRRGV